MSRAPGYIAISGCAALVASAAGFQPRQVLATTILIGFIAGTLLFWKFRLALALAGVAVLLAAGVLDLPHLIGFAGLDVILFLVEMMVVVGFLEERRFFKVG
jgi:Na+/H+ antiporter NhaD/arsenite permease-like protein